MDGRLDWKTFSIIPEEFLDKVACRRHSVDCCVGRCVIVRRRTLLSGGTTGTWTSTAITDTTRLLLLLLLGCGRGGALFIVPAAAIVR